MKDDIVEVFWESIVQKAGCVARSRALRFLTPIFNISFSFWNFLAFWKQEHNSIPHFPGKANLFQSCFEGFLRRMFQVWRSADLAVFELLQVTFNHLNILHRALTEQFFPFLVWAPFAPSKPLMKIPMATTPESIYLFPSLSTSREVIHSLSVFFFTYNCQLQVFLLRLFAIN